MTYLAFDLGGTNIKYAVVTEDGDILIKDKFPSSQTTFEELINAMGEVHRKLAKDFSFLGIALSLPGAPNNETGFVRGASALPFIHGPNLHEALFQETGLQVYAENDAKCAALCEVWKGAAKDVDNSLFIIIGTGIGGAIVVNRQVHQGVNLLAGEYGYMILHSDFKKQEFHTFSNLGSTGSLVRAIAKKKGISNDSITGEEIFDLAFYGDIDCQEAIEVFYENIAVALFTLIYTFDPEKIIIGGAISARADLIDKISEKLEIIKLNIRPVEKEIDPPIVRCQYGGDANLLGAVYNYKLKS